MSTSSREPMCDPPRGSLSRDQHVRTAIVNHGNVGNQVGQQNIYGNLYNNTSSHRDEQSTLGTLPFAADAIFNARSKEHEELCLENTREELLREIANWADSDDIRRIYWLSGMAGTGKSTIARTVAAKYARSGRLAGSFFFSRGGGDVGTANKFVTTIARQLGNALPETCSDICKAIRDKIEITTLKEQWAKLVIDPLLKMESNALHQQLILVIDALDECEGEDDIRRVIELLSDVSHLNTPLLRVFLTSRPQTPIRHGFREIPDAHCNFILHEIAPVVVEQDISTYFTHHLRLLAQEKGLGAGWPDTDLVSSLAQRAGGLFIWAATACRFIREGRAFAQQRVSRLLEGKLTSKSPERKLDEIYLTVLQDGVGREYEDCERDSLSEMLRMIIGTIVTSLSPLSPNSLSALLQLGLPVVTSTLDDMHSILNVSENPTEPIRLHHPSFRDFLLDDERCTDPNFRITETETHKMLADRCIDLMAKELKQDMCKLRKPGASIKGIRSSVLDDGLPPELRYACRYWVDHLKRSGSMSEGHQSAVHEFLRKHFLHWLECLFLLGEASTGIRAIRMLENMAGAYPDLRAFMYDSRRFFFFARQFVERAPLQLYTSALAFAPRESVIRKTFMNELPHWVETLPEVQHHWSPLLQSIEIPLWELSQPGQVPEFKSTNPYKIYQWGAYHREELLDVIFAPSNDLVAILVFTQVWLWDVATGAITQKLTHDSTIGSIVFSQAGELVTTTWEKGTNNIHFWDTTTGICSRSISIEQSGCPLSQLAYTVTGRLVATSFSVDLDSVQIWDAIERSCSPLPKPCSLSPFHKISPDGNMVAWISETRDSVQIWDRSSDTILKNFGHLHVSSLEFSPDCKTLLTISPSTGQIKAWNIQTGCVTREFYLPGTICAGRRWVVFSRHNSTIALQQVQGLKCVIAFVDLESGSTHSTIDVMSSSRMNFSADSNIFVTYSTYGEMTVRVWESIADYDVPPAYERELKFLAHAFSPDGKQLCFKKEMDDDIQLRCTVTDVHKLTLAARKLGILSLAFSTDGRMVASGSGNATTILWDAESGSVIRVRRDVPHASVRRVAFSPDNKLVASELYIIPVLDSMVLIWSVETGEAVHTLPGSYLSSDFKDVFLADGKLIVTTFGFNGFDLPDGIRFWDVESGVSTSSMSFSDEIIGLSRYDKVNIYAAVFSRDGRLMAASFSNHEIRVWDTTTSTLLHVKKVHHGEIYSYPGVDIERLILSTSAWWRLWSQWVDDADKDRLRSWFGLGRNKLFWLPEGYRGQLWEANSDRIIIPNDRRVGVLVLKRQKHYYLGPKE